MCNGGHQQILQHYKRCLIYFDYLFCFAGDQRHQAAAGAAAVDNDKPLLRGMLQPVDTGMQGMWLAVQQPVVLLLLQYFGAVLQHAAPRN